MNSRRGFRTETAVFKTKIYKELMLSFAAAFLVSFAFILFFGLCLNQYLGKNIHKTKRYQQREEQVMTELQAFITQRSLSSMDVETIEQWEKQKRVKLKVIGTKESEEFSESVQKKYTNTILAKGNSSSRGKVYDICFKDMTVRCSPRFNGVKRAYIIGFVVIFIIGAALFMLTFMALVKKRISYLILLREEINSLKEGDLEKEITVAGEDELTQIAIGMNSMRKNVLQKMETEKQLVMSNHELITAMSHDLRTPLTRQIGYLEILSRKRYQNEQQLDDYIDKIRKNAFIIKDTTDKLFRYFLAFSNQEMKAKMTEVSGKTLLNSILKEQQSYMESQDFAVSFMEIKENFYMMIDLEDFSRIFDNLFQNIKKYGDKGVVVSFVYEMQRDNIRLILSNGIRKDNARVESTKIGLKIVEKVMLAIGGKCEMEDNGDVFTVILDFPIYAK